MAILTLVSGIALAVVTLSFYRIWTSYDDYKRQEKRWQPYQVGFRRYKMPESIDEAEELLTWLAIEEDAKETILLQLMLNDVLRYERQN